MPVVTLALTLLDGPVERAINGNLEQDDRLVSRDTPARPSTRRHLGTIHPAAAGRQSKTRA
jgi:hypothetical protein